MKKRIMLSVVVLFLVTACTDTVIANCPPGATTCTLQVQGDQARKNVPVVTQAPKATEGKTSPTPTPSGLLPGTAVPTQNIGLRQATPLPTLVLQPSPTRALNSAAKTKGEKKLDNIIKALNTRGKEFRVKTLPNGVIVIPDDGTNNSVLITSLMTVAMQDGLKVKMEIQPGQWTDFLIKRMPPAGEKWLVIGINDEPASAFVTGTEFVPEGSTVVFAEMYPAKLLDRHLGVDMISLNAPDPQEPVESVYAKVMAQNLKKGGTGEILLYPQYAPGQLTPMIQLVRQLEQAVKDFGGELINIRSMSPEKLKKDPHYASNALYAFDADDTRPIFWLLTFIKGPIAVSRN